MTAWDGSGLPPAAAARMRRFQASPLRTSMLSAPAAAGIQVVGFDPVGEVMGCIVQRIGWAGYGGCGYYGSYGSFAVSRPIAASGGGSSYSPYLQALETGYDTALSRMSTEARAMGADGVVGVKLTMRPMDGNDWEFVAIGTAVRARGQNRPPAPFTTDLAGTDFAKLLLSGWTPVALQVGIDVVLRHDDYVTRQQASRLWNASNVEVSGYTELVQHARAFARDRFERRLARFGADGAIVSDIRLKIWEIEPSDGHVDHVAEATIIGTAIARFAGTGAPPTAALTVLPVRNRRQTATR
jgi:uncharacterized protein YbjQ (UPF0145 family)